MRLDLIFGSIENADYWNVYPLGNTPVNGSILMDLDRTFHKKKPVFRT